MDLLARVRRLPAVGSRRAVEELWDAVRGRRGVLRVRIPAALASEYRVDRTELVAEAHRRGNGTTQVANPASTARAWGRLGRDDGVRVDERLCRVVGAVHRCVATCGDRHPERRHRRRRWEGHWRGDTGQ